MIGFGILGPSKVTRNALHNAASIAGLMITTEAMVAEAPKKDGGGVAGTKRLGRVTEGPWPRALVLSRADPDQGQSFFLLGWLG